MGTAWSSVWQCRALGWWDGGSWNGGSQLEAATSFSLPHLAGGERALPCLCTRSGSAPVALSLLPVPAVPGPRKTSSSTSFAEFWQLQHVLHDKSLFLALFSSLPLSGATVSFPPAISSSAFPSSWTMHLLAPLLPSHEATPCPAGDQVPAVARDQACVSPPAEHCREGSGGLTCCFSPRQASPRCEQPRSPPAPAPTCCRTAPGGGPIRAVPTGRQGTGSSAPSPAPRSLIESCSRTTPSTARAARRARAAPNRPLPTSLLRRKKVPALPEGGVPFQPLSSSPASLRGSLG